MFQIISVTCPKVNYAFLIYCFILMTVLLQDVNCKDEASHGYFGTKNKVTIDLAERYVQALEDVDQSETSLLHLTSAIKNLFDVFDFLKQDELSSFLFVFPNLRRDIFPFSQYKTFYKHGFGGEVTIFIFRVDGTMFIINLYRRRSAYASLSWAVSITRSVSKADDNDVQTFGLVKQNFQHKIFIGLRYWRPTKLRKLLNSTISVSYLCDSWDLSNAVNVTM